MTKIETLQAALHAFNAAREALSERDADAQYHHAVAVALDALEAAAESLDTAANTPKNNSRHEGLF